LWRQVDVRALDFGWELVSPALVASVTAAQVTAARQAAPYMNRVAEYYGGSPDEAVLVPEAFGGATNGGLEIGPEMFGAVTTTKRLIGRGVLPERAFEAGAAFLATVVGAAVQDAGRQADSTLAAGRGWVRYVRVINPGACSRCAILAGSDLYSRPFLRHPRCKCTSWPVESHRGDNAVPNGMFSDPGEYFDSLSRPEQDRVFTKAGAEAIRLGADPMKVVNARRGATGVGYSGTNNAPLPASVRNRMKPTTIGYNKDGSPIQVYATTEGTTARGSFGSRDGRYRRSASLRLMPESILQIAGDNPVRARELLTRYGYLR